MVSAGRGGREDMLLKDGSGYMKENMEVVQSLWRVRCAFTACFRWRLSAKSYPWRSPERRSQIVHFGAPAAGRRVGEWGGAGQTVDILSLERIARSLTAVAPLC
jgi:hypothetical protein